MNDDFEIALGMARVAQTILKKAIKKEYGDISRDKPGIGKPACINALDNLRDAEYALNAYVMEQLKLPF